MKELTKSQVEAIVGEVRERLESVKPEELYPGADFKIAREKLEKKLLSYYQKELAIDKMKEKVREMEEEVEDHDDKLSTLRDLISLDVKSFENKYSVDVDWVIEPSNNETHSITTCFKNHEEKIRRQIAIMGISANGPIDADSLIQSIVEKMTRP